VVPPILKPWPLTEVSPSFTQISLHQLRNQFLLIGTQDPSGVLKVKRGAEAGMRELDERWCSNAIIALQLHVESDTFILAPSTLVFVWGITKLIN